MKRKVFVTIFVALLLVLSFGFTACKKATPPEPAPDPEISIDITDARLDVYESLQITATTANTDVAVEWSSSDPSIATVDGGLVVACAEGSATIIAKAGDVSATCTVSVYNSWTAPVLVVDHDQISIAKGGSYTVTAKTKWKGNDITSNVEYSWSLGEGESGDIAGLAANGNQATFTGKEYGNAEFVVFATVNGVPLVQTVAVKVCNADIVFGVSNLERGVGGYSARLALLKLDETIIDIIPQITVYDANGVVDGAEAQMEWRIEGDAQAVVRDDKTGKISAVAEGEARVIGSYENTDLVINVSVYRPQVSLDGTVYFETNKLLPKTKGVVDPAKPAESGIAIAGLQGEVTGAKLGSIDIFSSYDDGENLLVINKNNLNTDRNILGETQTLVVDTDKAVYDISAKVVTLAIRTPDDLDSIAAVSADESTYWALKNDSTTEYVPYYWDGYYVLANDMDYMANQDGREFVTFIDWNSLGIVKNPDHPDADWVDGRYLGFRGTFDGQGYNIDNFKLKNVDTGGIFGVMATDGVFRNVSFTNAVNPGGTGLICSAGDGTIENVYIQCSSQTGGWNNNRSGMFYTRDIINTAAVKNVFVDTRLTYNESNTVGDGWIYAFGYAYPSSANYRGVYCVGTEKAYAEKYQGGTWVDNIYGAYNTYTDLRNSGVNFDEWAGDFWKIVNGFPYPKNLDLPTVDTTDAKTSITRVPNAVTDTVYMTVDKYAIVTLDAQSILAGVKLKGVEQSDSNIQKLEFVPALSERTVTVTVKSAFDPNDGGTQYSVELPRRLEQDDSVTMNFKDKKVLFVSGQPITLADLSDAEDFEGVKFENLTVKCGGKVVECTLNGDLLQFTPLSVGTYNLLYTHVNGNKIKTATQTITVCATREELAYRYDKDIEIKGNFNGAPTIFDPIDIAEFNGKALHFEFKFTTGTGKFGFAFMDNPSWANITGTLTVEKKADGTIEADKGRIIELSDGWYAWELNSELFAGDGKADANNVGLIANGVAVVGEVYIDWSSLKAVEAYALTKEDLSERFSDGDKINHDFGEKGISMSALKNHALSFEFKFKSEAGKFGVTFMDGTSDWHNVTSEVVIEKNAGGVFANMGMIEAIENGWYVWKLNESAFIGNGKGDAQTVNLAFTNTVGGTVQGVVYIDWNSLKAKEQYAFFAENSKIGWEFTSGGATVSSVAGTSANYNALQITNNPAQEYTTTVLTIDPAMTARLNVAKKLSMRLKLERNTAAQNLTFNFRIGTWKAADNPGDQHEVWAYMGDGIIGGYSDNIALDTWHTIDFFREADWGDSLTPLSKNGGKIFVWIQVVGASSGENFGYRLSIDDISVVPYDYVLDFETDSDAEIYARSYAPNRISTAEIVEGQSNSGSKAIKVFQNQYGALVIKIPDAMKAKITDNSKLTIRFMLAEVKDGSGDTVENPAAHTFSFSACSKSMPESEDWKDGQISGNDWLANCEKGTWYKKELSGELLTKVKDNGYLWVEVEMQNWQEYEFYVDFITLE